MNVINLSAQEFASKYEPNMRILDVRSPAEFSAQHVRGAKNIPLDQLQAEDFCQSLSASDELYVICHKGARAAKAAEALSVHTEARLLVVEGGTPDSIAHGCPCNSNGQTAISIDRQVRITAGGLVLLGTLLAIFVAEGFFAIPAFVGAGLLFSGLSDSCAMGVLLGKMPWNQ